MVMGTGVSNPFTDYLLGLVAQSDPSLVSNAAASTGLPPPSRDMSGAGIFGNLFSPQQAPQAMPDVSLGGGAAAFPEGVFTGMGGAPTIAQAPAGPGGGIPPGIAQALGSMAGVKAPPPVAAPIFNAGVSGAQKAPEGSAAGAGGAQMLQLMKLLQQSSGPAATPAKPLGSYF